ncbi:hypothetical protein T06_7487 [Trichinella sp. T6]|nr:hypothetical protein T06_7487 [Trichinella sp. T6]
MASAKLSVPFHKTTALTASAECPAAESCRLLYPLREPLWEQPAEMTSEHADALTLLLLSLKEFSGEASQAVAHPKCFRQS